VKYVGIDVHKKMCQAAVLDEDGELLDQIRFLNEKKEIKDFAELLNVGKVYDCEFCRPRQADELARAKKGAEG